MMETFLSNVANFGLGVACLIGAVYWLSREIQKRDTRREAEQKENRAREDVERAAFREERDKRIKAIEDQLQSCKIEIEECRKDRTGLHDKMHQMQSDNVNLLRSIIDQNRTVIEQLKKP